ncbi:MAG: PilZ domain-containing protein [Pseudomonadales bacterium]|nr:PilZ domain-containing protein [Pseudomonadales bacterium]
MENTTGALRSPLRCKMKIWKQNEPDAAVHVTTKDMSDTGVFVLIDNEGLALPIGTLLYGQVLEMPFEAPVLLMEVVRESDDGIGLRFKTED